MGLGHINSKKSTHLKLKRLSITHPNNPLGQKLGGFGFGFFGWEESLVVGPFADSKFTTLFLKSGALGARYPFFPRDLDV